MMDYLNLVNGLSTASAENVCELAFNLLPAEMKLEPWKYTGHGTSLLSNDNQLAAYLAAYGDMHIVKCKSAFQNFPFSELNGNIEIFDWGCGQGLGTLCLLDMLRDRDLLHLARRVTLIEPSSVALQRAEINVRKALSTSADLICRNEYLPGDGSLLPAVHEIRPVLRLVIHIFSNILDVDGINIARLAELVNLPGHINYIMCMGPMNTGFYHIDQFCSVFNPSQYIVNIKEVQYGFTKRTHHGFGCRAPGFKSEHMVLDMDRMNQYVAPTLICGRPVLDDYDPMMVLQNGILSQKEQDLCDRFSHSLDPIDFLYIKPDIHGDKPDMVVVRPGKGIMFVRVFDKDLKEHFPQYNTTFDEPNPTEEKLNTEIQSPIAEIKQYYDSFYEKHMSGFLTKAKHNSGLWSIVKMLVYFPYNTHKEVHDVFQSEQLKYITILGQDDVASVTDQDFLAYLNFDAPNRYMDSIIQNEFCNLISPEWHSHKQGDPNQKPDKSKTEFITSKPNEKLKIKGVAGCGKTLIMVNRAVNCQARSGKTILMLTYNCSLINYLRLRLGEVQADFRWDKFYIVNYHEFFNTQALNFHLKRRLNDFDSLSFFEPVRNKIKKYDAILVDEVQDYHTSWLRILQEYFLSENGEMLVFGDESQDIYDQLPEKKFPVIPGMPGPWTTKLGTGFRFKNPALASFASAFQEKFVPSPDGKSTPVAPQQMLNFTGTIQYWHIARPSSPKVLADNCMWIMQQYKINPSEVCVLSTVPQILRHIDYYLRNDCNLHTHCTFESIEEQKALLRSNKLPEDGSMITSTFLDAEKQLCRSKKMDFRQKSPYLKLSTIASFKGLESETIILILLPDNVAGNKDLYAASSHLNNSKSIYTAITRAKTNLFILDIGNAQYQQFFKSYKY